MEFEEKISIEHDKYNDYNLRTLKRTIAIGQKFIAILIGVDGITEIDRVEHIGKFSRCRVKVIIQDKGELK